MSFKSLALALAFAVIGTEAVQLQTEDGATVQTKDGNITCASYACCKENKAKMDFW